MKKEKRTAASICAEIGHDWEPCGYGAEEQRYCVRCLLHEYAPESAQDKP